MLFLRISLLLFTIVQLNSAIAGSPDEFWQEYQTSTQSGKVRSAVEHVRNLSTKLETDTPQQLQHKKSAILWFMATGGKDGFRKDIATPEEKKIMVNALVFATILHEISAPKDLLPIIKIRRVAGITTEDQATKTHLTEAQKVITATHILRYGSFEELGSIVQQLFNGEYIGMALHSKNLKSISTEQWQQEVKEFASIFTLSFDRIAKAIFSNSLQFSIRDGYFGFKEPITETTAEEFRQLVLRNCTPDPEAYPQIQPVVRRQTSAQSIPCRPMRVETDKGTIERNTEKVIMNTTFMGRIISPRIQINDIKLNIDQTEEEFLAVIRSFANIINVIYS